MESTLGKRITANRKRLGLTQDQLAEKLGITAQAVSKWENDLSCPDISILPKLADIFGTSIDALLGREQPIPVCEGEVITEKPNRDSGFTYDSDSGKMDFHWEGVKLKGVGVACWVILTGVLYLVSQLLHTDISFWNILWPTFLLSFGLFGMFPKFSVFRFGCGLVGAYFLADKFRILSLDLNSGIIAAVIILLFGVGLLADVLRKKKHRSFPIHYKDREWNMHHGEFSQDYTTDGNHFTYDACFGNCTQVVVMDRLQTGSISTCFGEYIVDLSGVGAVEHHCSLEADCDFGELTILVPRQYSVIVDGSTSFAGIDIQGQPDVTPAGTIHLQASADFASICVRYL